MIRAEYSDLVGVPYSLGGRDPRRGLDCFGVLLELYRRAGVELLDVAPTRYNGEETVDPAAALEAFGNGWTPTTRAALAFGDVVLVRFPVTEKTTLLHVAVVVATAPVRVLHAHELANVCATRLERLLPWVAGFYRYTGAPA